MRDLLIRVFSGAATALALFAATPAHADQWIDAATGKPVDSGPIAGVVPVAGSRQTAAGNTVYETGWRPSDQFVPVAVKPNPGDPTHAHDPVSGRNFFYDSTSCQWKDAATGKPVDSGPIAGVVPVAGSRQTAAGNTVYETGWRPSDQFAPVAVKPNPGDPTHAHDPVSGRNFVRIKSDCPTKGNRSTQQPKPTEQVGSVPPPNMKPVLDAINAERLSLGLPGLKWNTDLAKGAQDYVNRRAEAGTLDHSPREGRDDVRENLSEGLPTETPGQMAERWLREKVNFQPKGGLYPNVCMAIGDQSADWHICSHYTQDIWPTTTDIGCAEASGHGFNWLDCLYLPGGNKDGRPVGPASVTLAEQFERHLSEHPDLLARDRQAYLNVLLGQAGTVEANSTPKTETKPEQPKPVRYQWIDVKTGKVVRTVPLSGRNLGGNPLTGIVQMEGYNPNANRAFNPKTGQNFAKQSDGTWIDVKTGKAVPTAPISGQNLGGNPLAGITQMEAPNATTAFNPKTGQNFAKVPVQQTQASATPPK